MLNYIVLFCAAFVFSFIMRSVVVYIHRAWFNLGFAGDSSGHFTMIRELKQNPGFERIEQYVIPNEFTYPLAFHRFCALFSLNTIKKYPYLPNLIIFSFFSASYLLYLFYFEKEILSRQDHLLSITGGIIYFVSVSNLIFLGSEIAYIKLSERLLARTTTALFILGTVNFVIWSDTVSFIVAVSSGAIALLASVFARQALFFSTPLLCLFFLDIKPLGTFAISFILSFIISGTFFLKSVRDVVLYWRIYKEFVKPYNLNNMTQGLKLSWIIHAIKEFRIKDLFVYLLTQDPTKLFFFFFEMFFLMALLPFVYHHPETYNIYIPILASLILYTVTATKRFKHLGESYRYIEYSLFFYFSFFSAYFIVTCLTANIIIWTGTYVTITLFMCALIKYVLKPNYTKSDKLQEFISRLSLVSSDVVFPIDMSFAIEISSRSAAKTFWWQPGSITSPELWKEYFEEYPFLKKDWDHLFNKHKVTHVLCRKYMLGKTSWKYDFSELSVIAESEEYIAYKVNRNY